MTKPIIYPFTAIVGQEKMKRGLILNAVSPRIGGILIRGERGTAKSTASRALAALLPEDTPFIDLPVSATEDRVIGTLDIEKAIQKGEKHFEPGVLYYAHQGLLYVDEVNLLDDHIVDLLLDASAMGVNIIEREGISHSHPAEFILVGTMNPEEGDLRPQLLDRFAFAIQIAGLKDARQRMEIMERRIAFEIDPQAFQEKWGQAEADLSARIMHARRLVNHVAYSRRDLAAIAGLTASMNVDGHRADLVILRAAQANAALRGESHIHDQDILVAAELALPHRMKTRAFETSSLTPHDLEKKLDDALSEWGSGDFSDISDEDLDETPNPVKKNNH